MHGSATENVKRKKMFINLNAWYVYDDKKYIVFDVKSWDRIEIIMCMPLVK